MGECIPCGYSMPTIWTFDSVDNKHDVYRGEHCTKNLCVSLRQHAREIINFKKKKMMLLTNQEYKLYLNKKKLTFVKKNWKTNVLRRKNVVKLKTTVVIQVNIEVLYMVSAV